MTQIARSVVIKTARVAKLVDAPGLGPDERKFVPVRVRLRAPVKNSINSRVWKDFQALFLLPIWRIFSQTLLFFPKLYCFQFGKDLGNLGSYSVH